MCETWNDVSYVSWFDPAAFDAEAIDLSFPADIRRHHAERVLPSLRFKNSDGAYERERRLIVDGWAAGTECEIDISDAVSGIAMGVSFEPSGLPSVETIASAFGVVDSVAMMVSYPNVLVPFPATGADGALHAWTDSEARDASLIFEP